MAVDYTEMMHGGRQEDTAAARAPVVSFERVKPKRLTKKAKSALLKRRNAEKNTMARKKPRSAKQKAATKKMIAAAKRARNKSKGGSKGRTRRKTVRARNRGARAAAVVIARETKIGRTHPVGRAKPRKRKAKKAKGSSKRRRTSGRRRARAVIVVSAGERKRRRRSGGRRRSVAREMPRRRRRGGSRRRRGAMENPLTGVELFIGTLTGLMGFGTADVVDRLIATHPLTGVTSGTITAYTDVPPTGNPAQGTKATYGSLFNSTAVCAPMNLERWGVGLLISGVPILIGHFVSAPVGRSSLQFFGFGAFMRVAGKGLIDLVATLSKSNSTGQRLYSGEQRAAAIYANDGSASSLPGQAMTGLGARRAPAALGAAPTLAMHQAGCGCGKCSTAGAGYPSMPAPQQTVNAPAPPVQASAPPANTATNDQNIAIRGVPRGSGFSPRPGVYNWGEKAA